MAKDSFCEDLAEAQTDDQDLLAVIEALMICGDYARVNKAMRQLRVDKKGEKALQHLLVSLFAGIDVQKVKMGWELTSSETKTSLTYLQGS